MVDDKKIIISACLVLYDNEDVIERCLESIAPVVDEIIVIHDGPCHDKTLEIATRYQAKIIIGPRTGEAEPLRTLSYEATQGEWILQIDADEFLSPELQAAIPQLVLDKNIAAYEFLWPIYDGQRYVSKHWPYKRCLFRRSVMSYLGMPNSFVVSINGVVKKLPLLLEHKPNYNNYSWPVFKTKWVTLAKLQANLYLKNFSEINKFNWQADNWPKKVLWRRRFPLLIAPVEFIVVVFKCFLSGAYKESFSIWKNVFMLGAVRFLIDWYLFLGKLGGKMKN